MDNLEKIYRDLKIKMNEVELELSEKQRQLSQLSVEKQSIIIKKLHGELYYYAQWRENGKVKSKLGPLRYRPGFHINDVAPYVSHIGQKVNGKITYMRPDTVWAMVEYCIDHDYCEEAEANGISASGKFNYIKADLDYIPKHGSYRYKTSPVMTGEWIIAGEMKVIKILSDQEVKEICDSCGSDYLPRKETINLSEFGFAA